MNSTMNDKCQSSSQIDSIDASESEFESEEGTTLENLSFDIQLEKAGHESGFHTLADPKSPEQRQTPTSYHGSVNLQGKALEVIHGDFGTESDLYASLLVYEFRFNRAKRLNRIPWASILFEFSSASKEVPAPRVHALSPLGTYVLLPINQDEEVTREAEVNAGAGQMGVRLGGAYRWVNKVSCTTTHHTTIDGMVICNKYGYSTGVQWVVEENRLSKTGVPAYLRTAILLQREHDTSFQAAIKIKLNITHPTFSERFFGAKTKDDPILYNPRLPPTNNLRTAYDTQELGSIDVGEFFDASPHTTFGDVVKKHGEITQIV